MIFYSAFDVMCYALGAVGSEDYGILIARKQTIVIQKRISSQIKGIYFGLKSDIDLRKKYLRQLNVIVLFQM